MQDLFKNMAHLMTYRDKVDVEGLRELMDKILSGVNVGWELGVLPDNHAVDQLSLSVIYNIQFMRQVAEYVQLPIYGEGWQIDIGIPPRDWEMCFQIKGHNGQVFDIQGSEWVWLVESDEVASTVFLRAPPDLAAIMTEQDLLDCADILIVGELGEINFLNHISAIKLLLSAPASQHTLPMCSLREYFTGKYPQCQYAEWMRASRTLAGQ